MTSNVFLALSVTTIMLSLWIVETDEKRQTGLLLAIAFAVIAIALKMP